MCEENGLEVSIKTVETFDVLNLKLSFYIRERCRVRGTDNVGEVGCNKALHLWVLLIWQCTYHLGQVRSLRVFHQHQVGSHTLLHGAFPIQHNLQECITSLGVGLALFSTLCSDVLCYTVSLKQYGVAVRMQE